jgi:hypothetical protein
MNTNLFSRTLAAGLLSLGLFSTVQPRANAASLVTSSVWGTKDSADYPKAVARDKDGNLYVLIDFPNDHIDLLVLKLDPSGSEVLDNVLIGGMEEERGADLDVDAAGNVYVLARSESFDSDATPKVDEGFPLTENAYLNGDMTWLKYTAKTVLFKLNPEMDALLYSTRLHMPSPYALDLDAGGRVYIAGASNHWYHELEGKVFQHQNQCIQNQPAPFVAAFDMSKAGSDSLVYATYFAGTACGEVTDVAVDADGNAHLTGNVESKLLPTPNAPQRQYQGGRSDGFAAKVSPTGGELLFATHVGGGQSDRASGIGLDKDGNVYVTGSTYSDDLPTTPGVIQPENPNGSQLPNQLFVFKYLPNGSIGYGTYLGGKESESYDGAHMAVGEDGSVYLTGATASTDFPMVDPVQKTKAGNATDMDGFVSVLDPTGAGLAFSTFLGGEKFDGSECIVVDEAGKSITVLGYTASKTFVTKDPLAIGFMPGNTADRGEANGDVYFTQFNLAAPPAPMKGDANLDKKVDVGDAITVLQAAVGQAEMTEEQQQAADVIKDNRVDVTDAVKILKVAVGTDVFD